MLKSAFVAGQFCFPSTERGRTEQTHSAGFIENWDVGDAEESFLFWVLCSSIPLAFFHQIGPSLQAIPTLITINSCFLLWGDFFLHAVNTKKIINFFQCQNFYVTKVQGSSFPLLIQVQFFFLMDFCFLFSPMH